MFKVYEVFKSDGKKFLWFESDDRFTCEVYVSNHCYDSTALRKGNSVMAIEEA
jgi:hypothetical protein